jgi:hypothetical protein
MAPEVMEAKPRWTNAADVYAFAVTAWETLHRTQPWSELGVLQLAKRVRLNNRPTFDERLLVKPWLQDLIAACWDTDAGKRPTAADVAERFAVNASADTAAAANAVTDLLAPFLLADQQAQVYSRASAGDGEAAPQSGSTHDATSPAPTGTDKAAPRAGDSQGASQLDRHDVSVVVDAKSTPRRDLADGAGRRRKRLVLEPFSRSWR